MIMHEIEAEIRALVQPVRIVPELDAILPLIVRPLILRPENDVSCTRSKNKRIGVILGKRRINTARPEKVIR